VLLGPLLAGLARSHYPLHMGGAPHDSEHLGQGPFGSRGAPAPPKTTPGPVQPRNADSCRNRRRPPRLARVRRCAALKQPPSPPNETGSPLRGVRVGKGSHPRLLAAVAALEAALQRPERRLRGLYWRAFKVWHQKA